MAQILDSAWAVISWPLGTAEAGSEVLGYYILRLSMTCLMCTVLGGAFLFLRGANTRMIVNSLDDGLNKVIVTTTLPMAALFANLGLLYMKMMPGHGEADTTGEDPAAAPGPPTATASAQS